MPRTPRMQYRVRIGRFVAGSFLAAASAASVACPAGAAAATDAGASTTGPRPAGASAASAAISVSSSTPSERRLRGVRAELDDAVALHLVSAEQAERFYAQIERRVVAGL